MIDDRGRHGRHQLHGTLAAYHADALACLDSGDFRAGRFGHQGESAYFRPTLRAGDPTTTDLARRAVATIAAARAAAMTPGAAAHFRDVLLPALQTLISANLAG